MLEYEYICTFVSRQLAKSDELDQESNGITYATHEGQYEVSAQFLLNSSVLMLDHSYELCLHSKLILSKCHLKAGFLVRSGSHSVKHGMRCRHSLFNLETKEATTDVRGIEQEEPHLTRCS